MASERNWANGMRRCVGATVRSLARATVQLQAPAPPVAGDDGEALGLRTPVFQYLLVKPVLIRRSGNSTTVVVPASTLEKVLGIDGAAGVKTAMHSISTVLVNDASFSLLNVEVAVNAGNEALLYRLLLEGEGIEVI